LFLDFFLLGPVKYFFAIAGEAGIDVCAVASLLSIG
jgi:hypothetical protein